MLAAAMEADFQLQACARIASDQGPRPGAGSHWTAGRFFSHREHKGHKEEAGGQVQSIVVDFPASSLPHVPIGFPFVNFVLFVAD